VAYPDGTQVFEQGPSMAAQESHAFGSDSFLDVVTNMVGILIVLVMVVGVQIKHGPTAAALSPAIPPDEISRLRAEADSLENNVHSLEDRIAQVALSSQASFAERNTLALLAEERERELEGARESLDTGKKSIFDLRRAKSAADSELEQIAQGLQRAVDDEKRPKKATVQIKNYPTPLSKTVSGPEAHFRLFGGRIAWVPFKAFEEACERDAIARIHRLRDVKEIVETVGPIDGFIARYKVGREDLSPEEQILRGGRTALSFEVVLIPQREDLGEPTSTAFQPGSQFQQRLAGLDARRTAVTFWVYPDGFSDYSTIKELLYKQGFTVAARPTPEGQPIMGSNHGSRSHAQ
jgi:hypothetical protein